MTSIKIGREQAAALDKMLRECDNQNRYFEYNEPNKDKYESLSVTANILEQMGYARILVEQGDVLMVQLMLKGKTFIKNDSFVSRIEEKEAEQKKEYRIREMNEAKHLLTLKQLKAAKREPYYILFLVISGIANLILAYLQFMK